MRRREAFNVIDLRGEQRGCLVVVDRPKLGPAARDRSGCALWVCECQRCGARHLLSSNVLRSERRRFSYCKGCRPAPRVGKRVRTGRNRSRRVRAKTISSREAVLECSDVQVLESARPRTRGECLGSPRPCPFVSCRWHLYLDVSPQGAVKINFPDVEPEELTVSCALDVADDGGRVLDEIAPLMNLSTEGARLILVRASEKIRRLPILQEQVAS